MSAPLLVADSGPLIALARLDLLALQRGATVLVDERHGRACATGLGLSVIGILGLLVSARAAGMVPPVRPLIGALLASGYFLAQPLVDKALAAIGE
jgi:uncharacterized protein